MKDYLDILGYTVVDKVTGFEGTASTVGFDLYGCVQVIVTPSFQGKDTPEGRWFDFSRLERQGSHRKMEPISVPTLATRVPSGGYDKPIR